MTLILSYFLQYWFDFQLPNMDIESARWALSTQVQATAAFLTLLLAIVLFRWQGVSEYEEKIKNQIDNYLKRLSESFIDKKATCLAIMDMYQKYFDWVAAQEIRKIDKIHLKNIGRLWVIQELARSNSQDQASAITTQLKWGQIKHLNSISIVARDAAADLWAKYFVDISGFAILMLDTLQRSTSLMPSIEQPIISPTKTTKIPTKKNLMGLYDIQTAMVKDSTRPLAERIHRRRTFYVPLFYTTFIMLSLAVIIGLFNLSSLGAASANMNLKLVIELPVFLSLGGLYLSGIISFLAIS